MNDIVKEIDSYIKRTIINTVKNFKKYEIRKFHREFSIEELSDKLDNDETALLSYTDNHAVFSLHLEDNVKDEKLSKIIEKLSEEEKEILTLCILEEWTSKEIGDKFAKSDSRIRNIIRYTITKIREKYNREE